MSPKSSKVDLPFYAHLTIPDSGHDHSVTYNFGPFRSMEEGMATFPVITRELQDGYLLWMDQKLGSGSDHVK